MKNDPRNNPMKGYNPDLGHQTEEDIPTPRMEWRWWMIPCMAIGSVMWYYFINWLIG